jgi:hypothetical protein
MGLSSKPTDLSDAEVEFVGDELFLTLAKGCGIEIAGGLHY